ncbi:long-chain specific acyl-CoA dehydrogenase, mitochondrial-like [Hyalella azteca]|uniref:Long-chain specific acyl-CoA dehydrogenase, mitochondrial-like n=1 Tax=Hyalella azteca TaxID=294128 RepID=A0A8B7PEB2_HYAAZ|nr:long-chain specific acyl-CoA dehydrogenase, mitochondrial-like [Hyalella azteca]
MYRKMLFPSARYLRTVSSLSAKLLSTTSRNLCSHADAPQRLPTSQADTMMDIGTRSLFNSDHDLLRQTARRFFTEEVKPHLAQWEADGQVSREVWRRAGELGFLGINFPVEIGGNGGDFLDVSVAIEEQAYAQASGAGFFLHSQIIMPYITRYGTPEQVSRYLPDMLAGNKISAIAMTEPGAGSDLQGIKTRAVRDGDDWILNGSKTYITNGSLCDVVLVVAVTDPDAKSRAHGLSLFLVDAGTKGFNKGKKLQKLGLKAQDTSELFFEDVRLPKEALLGTELNKGFPQLMQELSQERLCVGIFCMAWCEVMFEDTRNFIRDRKAFGKSLTKMQVIQHKMAELKTSICVARAFTDQCIDLHKQKRLDQYTAAMLKYWVSDLANKVAYDCLQLHGGSGYMLEYPISRSYVDVRVQTIYAGTNEIMKELIARTIVV